MRCVIRPGVCLLVTVLLFAAAAPARASQRPDAARAAQAEDADQQPKPAPQPRTPTPAPRPGNEQQPQRQPEGRPVNIQIEVTITDQVESEAAQKKTVSMIVADRAFGRVRATNQPQPIGPSSIQLNVDARPGIQANDTIRLELTLEYQPSPPASTGDGSRRPSTLTESLTVILQPGKPLTVSRAVDPFTNRRTSVDVTATIMK